MKFQAGDIAACYGACAASRLIELGTASPLAPRRLRFGPSHVAMLCEHRDSLIWVESTALCRRACRIQKRIVRGTQAHDPLDRIHDYTSGAGHVDIYRLSPIHALTRDESRLLEKVLIRHFVRIGIDYDLGGALLSGTRLFRWSRLFPGADLQSLFCSELVAATLMRLGRMNHENPTRYNPARLLRELVTRGTYQWEAAFGSTTDDRKQQTRMTKDARSLKHQGL
ncbi:MAG: hypothetical protein AB7O26_18950 [Planctomycetaceae bacterium]